MGFLLKGIFALFFLLVLEGLAFRRGFKVKYPSKIGGTSTHWVPLFPKFLTRSLMSNHHDLNLGEGGPILVREVKGISGLDTSISMRFSFLKPEEATTTGKVKVERCPNTPWSKPN